MTAVHLFVEGADPKRSGQIRACRQAFEALLKKRCGEGIKLSVTPSGGRGDAYKAFKSQLAKGGGDILLLLVDSERAVDDDCRPWRHVKQSPDDRWDQPAGTNDEGLHFMAQSMEAWVLADSAALIAHFGDKIDPGKLPPGGDLEKKAKADLPKTLNAALKKGAYHKVDDGFAVLRLADPDKIVQRCPRFAKRFFDHMAEIAAKIG